MTAKGYTNMSIKPEAKRGLELLAFDLSNEFGRRVSLSEALELAMDAIYGNEVEILDPQGATNAGQEWTTAYDGNGNVVGQR
jgi:YD repeat-containing protein